jgi:RES domain-containing protein
MSPAALLKALGNMVSDLDLIETMVSGTDLYRVRVRDKDASWVLDFEQLGPPPNEKAKAGRMNPAGISYFYQAKDSQTAFAEVIQKPPCNTAMAHFKTSNDLRLLNLCDIPSIPSIFDETGHEHRELIYFLLNLVKQISKPVSKNGQEHIDYVASQIVSEYFSKEFRTKIGSRIDGLTYPSSVRRGGDDVILFQRGNGFKGFNDLASLESSREVGINNWSEAFTHIS